MTTKPADWIGQACRLAARELTQDEWSDVNPRPVTAPDLRPQQLCRGSLPLKVRGGGAEGIGICRVAGSTGGRRGHSGALVLLTRACPPLGCRAGAAAGRGVRPAPPS